MSRQLIRWWVAAGVLAWAPVTWSVDDVAEPQKTDEIVVRFERPPVRSEAPVITNEGKTETGMPVVLTEIRHHVRIDDLDLATDAGADALVKRLRAVARQGCAELDRIYALAGPDASCTNTAVRESMPQVNAAIARAKAKPGARGD